MVREPRARGWRLPYDPPRLYGVGAPTVLGVEIVLDATSKREVIVYYEVSYTAEKVIAESLYRYWAGQQDGRGVFLIDELEDSLHPKLTEKLLRRFLGATTGEDQRRQLIFMTHELHLLRSDMLRRDEIWLVEKRGHNSELVRLTDFSGSGVRKGADLRKIYMSGRLGGVPRI